MTMITRRTILSTMGASMTALAAAPKPLQVKLSPVHAPTELSHDPPAGLPADQRIGYAVVGIGRLSLEEILPAFAQSRRAKVTALVSGDPDKARTVARQYGVDEKHLYDYASFDRLADDPTVQAVYIVLPNSMHAEFTIRAAKAGKHVLCEKPMSNTTAEARQMIDACKAAKVKLMTAYRLQYEPHHRALIQLARSGGLGTIRQLSADNGQNAADPKHWRLNKKLAGGGPLPDVGIYCLNAARYLSGEEPIEVFGMQTDLPNDPRFKEVEASFDFLLRFPSGFVASCTTSYVTHDSKRLRLMGSEGWADMPVAFNYRGLQLTLGSRSKSDPKAEDIVQRRLGDSNQFARELDHFAECIQANLEPHTGGEEGAQDVKLVELLYQSAKERRPITLEPVKKLDATRGPPPSAEL